MDISIHTLVIVLALIAALVINIIAGNLITACDRKGQSYHANIKAKLDQDNDHNQGPVLMILKAQDKTMVITYIMMTPEDGNGHAHMLPSLTKDWNANCPLLKPNLFLFYIKP